MINFTVRFKNPVFLTTFLTTLVAFVYQILAMFDVVPGVSQSDVVMAVSLVVNMLAALGILVDPTTKGIKDSEQALGYDELA